MRLVIAMLLCAECLASDWYASPTGTGTGSISSPWFLQTALTNNLVVAGDTIWLRGGTYFPVTTNTPRYPNEPTWQATVTGTNNALITLRSYPGELAKLDRPWCFGEFVGVFLRFRDLEFYDSLKGSHTTNISYPTGPWNMFDSKNSAGTGNEWINCLVHDVDNCWAYETMIRGCIIWNVGLNGLEHVNYPVGASFVGNISAWHVSGVINSTMPSGSLVASNIMFGAGQSSGGQYYGDIGASGGAYVVQENYTYNYYSTDKTERSVSMGSSPSGIEVFSGNVIASQNPVSISSDTFSAMSFTNNVLVMNSGGQNYEIDQMPTIQTPWAQDYNSYYARSPNTVVFRWLVTNFYNFSQWKIATGFDSHSTSADATVPANAVYLIPNQDQAKRAHIAIYNWTHADNVTVTVSSVLDSGNTYQLYDAQNYNQGPIKTGTLSGSTITVPMTNLTAAPWLYSTNWGLSTPPPMSPEFGAFVLIGSDPNPFIRVVP